MLAMRPRLADNARECIDFLIICRRGMTRVVVEFVCLERRRGLRVRRERVKARVSTDAANAANAAAAATKGARKGGIGGGRLDAFGLGLWRRVLNEKSG